MPIVLKSLGELRINGFLYKLLRQPVGECHRPANDDGRSADCRDDVFGRTPLAIPLRGRFRDDYDLHARSKPGLAADFASIAFLHRGPELIAFLSAPSYRYFVDCSASVLPSQLDVHVQVGQLVHLQNRWVDDFAAEVLPVCIGARRYASNSRRRPIGKTSMQVCKLMRRHTSS